MISGMQSTTPRKLFLGTVAVGALYIPLQVTWAAIAASAGLADRDDAHGYEGLVLAAAALLFIVPFGLALASSGIEGRLARRDDLAPRLSAPRKVLHVSAATLAAGCTGVLLAWAARAGSGFEVTAGHLWLTTVLAAGATAVSVTIAGAQYRPTV